MAQTYLTHYGYHIDINSISNDKFTQIISDLTVHPINKDLTEKQIKEATFEIYKYSDDRTQIIVPRYY